MALNLENSKDTRQELILWLHIKNILKHASCAMLCKWEWVPILSNSQKSKQQDN